MIARLLALTVVAAVGCTTDRMADLRDCGRLSAGVGYGLGAEVGLGIIGNPSIGIIAMKACVGTEDRDRFGVWDEGEMFWPASSVFNVLEDMYAAGPRSTPFMPYKRTHIPTSEEFERQRSILIATNSRDKPAKPLFRCITDFEASVTLVCVGVRVGINPLEILDFLLGFVGIDLTGDDESGRSTPADVHLVSIERGIGQITPEASRESLVKAYGRSNVVDREAHSRTGSKRSNVTVVRIGPSDEVLVQWKDSDGVTPAAPRCLIGGTSSARFETKEGVRAGDSLEMIEVLNGVPIMLTGFASEGETGWPRNGPCTLSWQGGHFPEALQFGLWPTSYLSLTEEERETVRKATTLMSNDPLVRKMNIVVQDVRVRWK